MILAPKFYGGTGEASMLKSVLITGGGSGIGAALAVALAERGCQVIISGRRLEMLKPVAEKSANITAHASDVP